MAEMRCSSCSGEMSVMDENATDGSQTELRCTRCGSQYIRSRLVVQDDAFEMDPFLNYQRMRRLDTDTSPATEESNSAATNS